MVGVALQELDTRGIARIQEQSLRTRLRVFQVIRGFRAILPDDRQQIPGVDRWIEVDECRGSLRALGGFHAVRAGLAKRLELHDGARHGNFTVSRLLALRRASCGSRAAAVWREQRLRTAQPDEAERKQDELAVGVA